MLSIRGEGTTIPHHKYNANDNTGCYKKHLFFILYVQAALENCRYLLPCRSSGPSQSAPSCPAYQYDPLRTGLQHRDMQPTTSKHNTVNSCHDMVAHICNTASYSYVRLCKVSFLIR